MVDDQKVVDSPSLWRTRQGTRFNLARFGNGRWQALSISFGFPRPRSSLPEDTLLPRRSQTIPSDAEITRISVSSRLKDHEDGQYSCSKFAVHFHSNFQSRTTSARQSYLPWLADLGRSSCSRDQLPLPGNAIHRHLAANSQSTVYARETGLIYN